MANIPENTTDPILRPVTRLETTTKVFGGEYIPDDEQQRGISNLQAIELAERDQYIISRVGQAKVDPSGDIPGEPGIAPLDTSGKLPKSNNTANVVFTSDTQTLTNKTISYADNTMPGVVGETAAQTLTNKTISYANNTMPGVVGETATQTLTNKTISYADNTMPGVVGTSATQTITNKTIAFGDNTMTDVASTNTTQTLTNKTIDYADNTLTGVQPTIIGGASSITSSDLTADKVLVSDASGKVAASSAPSTIIGAGENHVISTGFLNGYTGTLQWQVTNGICTVGLYDFGRSSGDGRIAAYDGLPTARMDVYSQVGDNYGNVGVSGNTLSIYQGAGYLTKVYHTISYPVSPSWFE